MQIMNAGFICHISAGQRANYDDKNVTVSYKQFQVETNPRGFMWVVYSFEQS